MTSSTKSLLLLLCICFCTSIRSQNHFDNNWILSNHNGAIDINFSTGYPKIDTVDVPVVFEGASSVISNEEGELQFYTNGCAIYNWSHELMENGGRINPGSTYDDFCNNASGSPRGYPGTTQSIATIPFPDQPDNYLLIHIPNDWLDPTDNGASLGSYELLYSQVDMSAQEGLGEVVAKNVIVDERGFEDQQALNRHANGTDWWLVVPLRDTNQYAVYLVDSSGIELVSIQEIGLEDSRQSRGGGQSVFTPFGDKYLRYTSISGLQIFDFDRTTGQLSDFQFVPMNPPDRPEIGFGGLGISPNGRFAYVSTIFTVYQYDLAAEDIPNSRVRVGEVGNPDSLWVGLAPTSFNFQLGPDCKLYNYVGSADKYHVIHQPNEKGRASQWEQGALELPFWFFRDEPYFPHFRLGPLGDEGSPCAKQLIVSNDRPREAAPVYLSVYPNPATGPFSLSLSGVLRGQATEWALYDGQGRLVRQERLRPGEVLEISRNGLRPGMYFWRLSAGGRMLQRGKVVLVG